MRRDRLASFPHGPGASPIRRYTLQRDLSPARNSARGSSINGYGRRRLGPPPQILHRANTACLSGIGMACYSLTGRHHGGDGRREVIPLLDLICSVGQPAPTIEKFVDARWLSGYPVTVIETEKEFERLKSYVIE